MIPFNKQFVFRYGEAHAVSPLIRRVVARNPGRFTGPGTGTLIIGSGVVAVVDPGPDCEDHFDALQAALEGEHVSHVFATHQHVDHSSLGRRLAEAHGALLCGCAGLATDEHGGQIREEASDDEWFRPDIELTDGQAFAGEGWTLRAMHMPGHAATHFCFALEQEKTLLCGDHIMAWSTSIVSPPHGHMGDYIASLRRARDGGFSRLVPTHGTDIADPAPFVEAYIAHRLRREQQIYERVRLGDRRIKHIVESAYADVDRSLHPAAMHSVWAHLIHLTEQGRVTADPAPTIDALYDVSERDGA